MSKEPYSLKILRNALADYYANLSSEDAPKREERVLMPIASDEFWENFNVLLRQKAAEMGWLLDTESQKQLKQTNMNNTNATMMLVRDTITDGPFPFTSFRLIEISKDCPFLEARFNYYNKSLQVVSKEKFSSYHMLNRLDDSGEPMIMGNPKKLKENERPKNKMERRPIDLNYDYLLTHENDVRFFVKTMIGDLPEDFDTFFTAVQLPQAPDPVQGNTDTNLSVVKDDTAEKK